MNLKNLNNKKILILGLGKEGRSTFTFLRKNFPEKTLGLADQLPFEKLNPSIQRLIEKDKKIKLHLGKNYLETIKKYEIIFKTPGLSPFLRQIQRAKIPILSETSLFFDLCSAKIIGVTGTKGKGTTATLIYKILKKAGKKVFLAGNIGITRLKLLPKLDKNSWVVFELSSHQLYDLKKSPHISILLNIFPEHGDYYPTFKDYVEAKKNIALHQTSSDYFIYNTSLPLLNKIAAPSRAKKMPFSLEPEKNSVCFLKNDYLIWHANHTEEKIIKTDQVPLLGKFNLQNVMPAIVVGKILKTPSKTIAQVIKNFKPLKHRLEYLGKYKGIDFYDDSISTIPETAIVAIDALGNDVQTILLGGFERQQDFFQLAKKILESKIKTLILFPTTGKRTWKEILKRKQMEATLPKHFFVNNMNEAVKLAYQHTSRGKICLLSPASPSFGLFKNYGERGNLFRKYIKPLSKQ